MPYVKREEYNRWIAWVRHVLDQLFDLCVADVYIGYRGKNHKIVLTNYDNDVVLARGMKEITHWILLMQRRYKLNEIKETSTN